jgi:hypothetical protein
VVVEEDKLAVLRASLQDQNSALDQDDSFNLEVDFLEAAHEKRTKTPTTFVTVEGIR